MTGCIEPVDEITPAMARTWYERNVPHNRGVRPSVVEAYARDMLAGRWFISEHSGTEMSHVDLELGEHSGKILRGMITDQNKACGNCAACPLKRRCSTRRAPTTRASRTAHSLLADVGVVGDASIDDPLTSVLLEVCHPVRSRAPVPGPAPYLDTALRPRSRLAQWRVGAIYTVSHKRPYIAPPLCLTSPIRISVLCLCQYWMSKTTLHRLAVFQSNETATPA